VSSSSRHYQVTVVKYGTRSTTKSDVYLNFPLYHEVDAPIEMDYFFWILTGAERTIVVDTGFSPEGGRVRQRRQLAPIPELFEHFGTDPGTSPDVVVTHAHYDHIGNLDHFPSSRVIMARDEYNFWSSKHAQRVMFHHSIQDEEIEYLHKVNLDQRLVLFEETFEVAPGVTVTKVGGHTPGQCVVRVETSDGVVLLASDAIHYYEEYERDMLFMSVANLVDMYAGFDRIRELVASGDVTHLVSGHDPDTLNRFKPAQGPYAHLAATIGIVPKNKEDVTL
jgi:glyoxylase-like metal-dependent hydrolase (beta-lactamase superfamily II)